MTRDLVERAPLARGSVTVEARTPDGELVERRELHNACTDVGAADYAKALAGESAGLALTHIGLAASGYIADACETATGWSASGATVTADATTYRQGAASLRLDVAASATGTAQDAAPLSPGVDASAGSIECWLRLNYRGRASLAASALRVYTHGGGRFDATLAAIEAANAAFVDGAWALVRIPLSSFTPGAGTPDWTKVEGVGLSLTATSVGALQAWIDDVRVYTAPDTTRAATGLLSETTRKALSTLSRSTRTVTADAFWTQYEAVGQYYVAGLWAGSTLVAILPFTYYKAAGLTLRITWALTTSGG